MMGVNTIRGSWRLGIPAVILAVSASAQTLPGTQPFTLPGDPAAQMIEGMSAYLERATAESPSHRRPMRERLRYIIGAMDERVPFDAPELVGTLEHPAKLAETPRYSVFAVRWPVLEGVTAEGLLYRPSGSIVERVVALPDADQAPEDLAFARTLAESNCLVLVPVLIDRKDTWSGNPKFRMTNQTHREYIYRMAFPVGRHIIGYEVEKTLAAVDWFETAGDKRPIGVWGYGEGGLVALYTAALDSRVTHVGISGYFRPRESVWKEPIYRNVWALLRDFGDAEIASLFHGTRMVVDDAPGPVVPGPPPATAQRSGAAPGTLAGADPATIRREVRRAAGMGAPIAFAHDANPFPFALRGPGDGAQRLTGADPQARMHRQFQELVEYTQKMVRESESHRDKLWANVDSSSPEKWAAATLPFRNRIWNDVIGRLPAPSLDPNPRTRKSYTAPRWDGYEVTLDLWPGVFAYGVLLLPKDIQPGERRPVVVAQHGLDGRPQDLFNQAETTTGFHYYQNIASRLADLGFVVYVPQNPYNMVRDFRQMQRQANAVGLSMFSFILAQSERMLDWLGALPFVDPKRIGFYGLSYGGKTAVRVPPLLDRYALSICSGDFNEWIVKLTTPDAPYTYMFTPEYEIGEWNLGNIANHAELAKLMAPRPFMVERGHRDGVGVDEWVSYEYAKVRRFYDEMGIGDRTAIEFFNGPHMIHGVGTIEFLKKFLIR